jgi:hypothetical protein
VSKKTSGSVADAVGDLVADILRMGQSTRLTGTACAKMDEDNTAWQEISRKIGEDASESEVALLKSTAFLQLSQK